MSKLLKAHISFLPADEGGRSTPAMTGVRPQLKLGDVFTTCVVRGSGPAQVFQPGLEYEVALDVLFWVEYGHLVRQDMPIELYEGNRLVARGRLINDGG
jgi:translation elongation factor EF-Tu-like GTPase